MSEDALAAEALLGDEAQRFMKSDLGRLVLGLARQEVDRAIDDLLLADAADVKAIRDIQLRAQLGAKFEEWLKNIVADGEQSLQMLMAQRNQA